jgi:hypothetical protein
MIKHLPAWLIFLIAADFAIALELGKLHEKLPAATPFTIVSGDSEFAELKAHMGNRQLTTLNPHHADPEVFFVQMRSISET